MRVFQEIGDGGFVPDDFEILQRLGRISIQEVREKRVASGMWEPQGQRLTVLGLWGSCGM